MFDRVRPLTAEELLRNERCEVFWKVARERALALGLLVADAKGASLLLTLNTDSNALLSYIAAASAFAASVLSEDDSSTLEERANEALKRYDVTAWWSWSHPPRKPWRDDSREFWTAADVRAFTAETFANKLEGASL